ncbi:hypothetical protein [Draconibacterium mangrovi]|uniref:hypothetical protein n=1 Tax=Draconibacterium mangrovi TaxID=2697469 RepID=UPI0013D6AFFD|nr:hypothetical protein [Draconibacterium mangrovi]
MKVFKFKSDDYEYAISGKNEAEAKEAFSEFVGDREIESTEEIPESKWDEKFITMYEDNDRENEPFKVSIRDEMMGDSPTFIYSNDPDFMD